MNIDPFEPLKVLFIGVAALVLGMLVGGVPSYFIGKAHEAEKKGVQIGALATSVESCSVAAKESNALVKRERELGDAREAAMNAALAENIKNRPQYRGAVDRAMNFKPSGNTECERTVDVVRGLVMGGGR